MLGPRPSAALLGLILLAPLLGAASPARPTVAVLPLAKGAGDAAYDGLGTALGGMITTDLSMVDSLQLVERARLVDVLGEVKLKKTGYLAKATAQKLGRGLGAQMLVMGSFSVVKDRFVIDARLVAVESGAIVKAASANGEVASFVAVEKEVVEKLLDGLDVKLSMAVRRKVLMAAPTEDFSAMASYGRGVVATDAGKSEAARAAFEAALARDPEFGLASRALAALASKTKTRVKDNRTRIKEARRRRMEAAIAALPDETTRARGFVHTPQTMLDLTLRQALLRLSGQQCQRYRELSHFLVERDGEFSSFFAHIDGRPPAPWRAGEDLLVARATQLELAGDDEKEFGRIGRGLMMLAADGMTSGPSLLLSRNLAPEKFDETLVAAIIDCFPEGARLGEWTSIAKKARKWRWVDEPLWRVVGGRVVTVTARDSIDLTTAWFRADTVGVDARTQALTEAVLARHPEGDEDRGRILSRISEIVRTGEAFERRRATRLGMTETELLGAVRAVVDDAPILSKHELCRPLIKSLRTSAERALESYEKKKRSTNRRFREQGIDRLGDAIGALVLAGCHRAGGVPNVAKLEATVRIAYGRRHPGTLDEASCDETIASAKKQLAGGLTGRDAAETSRRLGQAMHYLHGLTVRRCITLR